MGEQPPWDPYGQHEPGQWHGQPPYPPQPPPGQPPYQETPYGQPYQQGQPPGQQARPASGHRRRPPRKSWPRRHKVLTALGALAALIIVGGIASAAGGRNQASPSPAAASSATSSPKTAHSAAPSVTASHTRKATQTAADACGKRGFASGDIYLRMIQPGQAPVAQQLGGEWIWSAVLSKCLTSVQFMIATAPQTAGTCTQVGYVADNPGYDVNAASAPPLENVVAQTGPAC